MTTILPAALADLRARIKGPVLRPGDDSYDEVRKVWNAMVDRKPAVITQCLSTHDIVEAVRFAREHDLVVAVRGGGHNIAGHAVCDGGIMIDLSLMKDVQVDAERRVARVGPGCLLSDMDKATQAHGLATPLGINSTTGVAGLTLGAGFGWLTRKHGMTIDNLLEAQVVTAEGMVLRASETENADLFWGVRGGGGNFGIVTEFTFRLHPVGPDVLSGLIVYPYDQAQAVLTRFAEYTQTMPDELSVWLVLRKAPPLPFLPTTVHGSEVVVLALCYTGDPAVGKRLIEPLRSFGTPHGEHVGVQPYVAWQQAFDPLLAPGARNYWKSHNFTRFNDGAIASVIEYGGRLPSPHCEIFVATLGGQAGRVPADAMAYSSRDANYVVNVHARWETPAEDEKNIAWARDFFAAARPHASGGVYVNFLTQDEADRTAFAYGETYGRLRAVKKKHDPTNLFRMNQNIKPE